MTISPAESEAVLRSYLHLYVSMIHQCQIATLPYWVIMSVFLLCVDADQYFSVIIDAGGHWSALTVSEALTKQLLPDSRALIALRRLLTMII